MTTENNKKESEGEIKSKGEIIKNAYETEYVNKAGYDGSALKHTYQKVVFNAMEAYASQFTPIEGKGDAIEFAEWLHKEWYKFGSDELWWNKISNTGGYKTVELYKLFKENNHGAL